MLLDFQAKQLQWSSRGGQVHLVDSQLQQLKDGVRYIDGLRSDRSQNGHRGGKINTATPDALKDVLSDSWLVVEVS